MSNGDNHIKQLAQGVCMPRGVCEQKEKTIKAEVCIVKKIAKDAKDIALDTATDMKKLYVVLIIALIAIIGDIGYGMLRASEYRSDVELARIVATEVAKEMKKE